MAWLSFSLSCAHFDISSMCQDMSNKVTGDSIPDYSFNNCFRLADLSKVICARMQTVSWFGLFFGLGTACIATNQAIEKYVEKSWENDNSTLPTAVRTRFQRARLLSVICTADSGGL